MRQLKINQPEYQVSRRPQFFWCLGPETSKHNSENGHTKNKSAIKVHLQRFGPFYFVNYGSGTAYDNGFKNHQSHSIPRGEIKVLMSRYEAIQWCR